MFRLFFILTTFYHLVSLGQTNTNTDKVSIENNKIALGLDQHNSKVAGSSQNNTLMAFDSRYEGVVNSYFLFVHLCVAKVFWGNSKSKNLLVKYDAVNKQLLSYDQNGVAVAVYPDSFTIIDQKQDQKHSFISPANLKLNNPILPLNYLQLLHSKSIILLKNVSKRFEAADYKGAFSVNRTYDSFVDNSEYYLIDKENGVRKLKLNGKSINKILKENGFEGPFKGAVLESDLVTYLQQIDL